MSAAEKQARTRESPDQSEVVVALEFMQDRFGMVPAVFDGYRFVRHSKKYLSLVSADHEIPSRPTAASVGIPFLRTNLRFPKPTTAAVLLFGMHATKNFVELTSQQAQDFVRLSDIILIGNQATGCSGTGYVIARYADLILGLGFFRKDDGRGLLKSLYPRAWSV